MFENQNNYSKESNFKEDTTNNLETNPFINSIDINLDKQEDAPNNDNPFFTENNIDTNEMRIENPFLNSITDIANDNDAGIKTEINIGVSNETIVSNDDSSFFEEKPTIKKVDEQKIITSTSPFFEEGESGEGNPFFQNQINLIENYTPSTSNTSIDTSKSKHYSVKVVKKKEPLFKWF